MSNIQTHVEILRTEIIFFEFMNIDIIKDSAARVCVLDYFQLSQHQISAQYL